MRFASEQQERRVSKATAPSAAHPLGSIWPPAPLASPTHRAKQDSMGAILFGGSPQIAEFRRAKASPKVAHKDSVAEAMAQPGAPPRESRADLRARGGLLESKKTSEQSIVAGKPGPPKEGKLASGATGGSMKALSSRAWAASDAGSSMASPPASQAPRRMLKSDGHASAQGANARNSTDMYAVFGQGAPAAADARPASPQTPTPGARRSAQPAPPSLRPASASARGAYANASSDAGGASVASSATYASRTSPGNEMVEDRVHAWPPRASYGGSVLGVSRAANRGCASIASSQSAVRFAAAKLADGFAPSSSCSNLPPSILM